MFYPAPKINIDGKEYELLGFEEFKERRGLINTSNTTIAYQLREEVDQLDYTIVGHFRYIIWNQKAKEFSLLNRRPSNTSRLSM